MTVKKARNLLFELSGGEWIAERSSAREQLSLDLRGQIIPPHKHGRPQTTQNVLFFLDQGSALLPV